MKKIASLIVLFVLLATAGLKAQDRFANWPALGTFHTVMSATFHPSEKGDLNPLRERSAELAKKASDLNKLIVPEEFKKPALKKALNLLAVETKALNKLIKKNSSDSVL